MGPQPPQPVLPLHLTPTCSGYRSGCAGRLALKEVENRLVIEHLEGTLAAGDERQVRENLSRPGQIQQRQPRKYQVNANESRLMQRVSQSYRLAQRPTGGPVMVPSVARELQLTTVGRG